jgi:2-keto-4-pentenoate hydratase/2-oxohepta-3-ene-1,7-dioic acid hydratase in catechol pathway
MRLATFTHHGSTRIGIAIADEIVDLAAAEPSLPREMKAFLAAGADALDRAYNAAAKSGNRLVQAEVKLEAPVQDPQKFLGAGLNYAEHIAETGRERPFFPTFFNKQSSCVNAPFDPVWIPRGENPRTDYEGELAFVIGKRCRRVQKERAHEVIAGYTIVDDVSVRDWQRWAVTMTLGKSWDTHGPMGPWIVTSDEISDPHNLDLKTWVNQELRQSSNTKHMIFDCFDMVEVLSKAFTLLPGDVISTGTPSGVGVAMEPKQFLNPGDVVRIEIAEIGHIEHTFIEEPNDTATIGER